MGDTPQELISRSFDNNLYFGILVVLIIGIFWFFINDRKEHRKEVEAFRKLLEDKNTKISELHDSNNKELLGIQKEMLNVNHNQMTIIKSLEQHLTELKAEIKSSFKEVRETINNISK